MRDLKAAAPAMTKIQTAPGRAAPPMSAAKASTSERAISAAQFSASVTDWA